MSEAKTLVPLGSTDVSTEVGDVFEELSKHAVEAAKLEAPELSAVSFRHGVLKIDDNLITNSTYKCLVLAAAFENAYYPGKFDPENPKSPSCYALSVTGASMGPDSEHDMDDPENETCVGCPKAEWGSADGTSRGKACKEIRRIIIMPATDLTSADAVRAASLGMAKIPVTSVKHWKNFVQGAAAYKKPYFAVTCQMTAAPHAKNQLQVTFDPVDTIADPEVMAAIMDRRQAALKFIMQPYSANEESEPDEKPGKKKKF